MFFEKSPQWLSNEAAVENGLVPAPSARSELIKAVGKVVVIGALAITGFTLVARQIPSCQHKMSSFLGSGLTVVVNEAPISLMHPVDEGHQRGGNIKVENEPVASLAPIQAIVTVLATDPTDLTVNISYDNLAHQGNGSAHIISGSLNKNYTNVQGVITNPPTPAEIGSPLLLLVQGKVTSPGAVPVIVITLTNPSSGNVTIVLTDPGAYQGGPFITSISTFEWQT